MGVRHMSESSTTGFPGEPIGAEAAIYWHLKQIDYHDHLDAIADAQDYIESSRWHETQAKAHRARLAALDAEYPETARVVRASLEVEYERAAEHA